MRKAARAPKRKYDSEDTKRRLLKAGLNVFSTQGYDAATTREIAKQAGVNLSLIPRYFENKLGLLFAIVHDFHTQLMSMPAPYPAADTLEEELRRFFDFRIEFAREHRKLLRLCMSQSILDPKFRQRFGHLPRLGVPWLIERIDRLRKLGKIRKDVDAERVSMLIGAIPFSINMFTEIAFSLDPEIAQGVLDQAVATLSAGLSPN